MNLRRFEVIRAYETSWFANRILKIFYKISWKSTVRPVLCSQVQVLARHIIPTSREFAMYAPYSQNSKKKLYRKIWRTEWKNTLGQLSYLWCPDCCKALAVGSIPYDNCRLIVPKSSNFCDCMKILTSCVHFQVTRKVACAVIFNPLF